MSQAPLHLPAPCEISAADPMRAFRVLGQTAALWYQRGEKTPRHLVVSFDNLASLDHPYPRAPWLYRHLGGIGCSFLGVQSHAKDWFRTEDPAEMIAMLAAQGFFAAFERVVFAGASMGGFGALNFAPLVDGAEVVAFSPQSTMQRAIAPFETRFPWAVRNSDWSRPEFLDAAAAIPHIPKVTLLYDPHIRADFLHAKRLSGPNVTHVKLAHCTHEAVRVVVHCEAIGILLEDVLATGAISPRFWQAYRARRGIRKWARAFAQNLSARGHAPRQGLAALTVLEAREKYLFAFQARQKLLPYLNAD
ncbi:hypothetical protein OE810_01875 [Rhodobacteraceae bacterium XHP0102]|nr:hypothetical protein [Rhodobacteraceae bacterium XHP0102]